jgi:hemolysin activation/secretion protein
MTVALPPPLPPQIVPLAEVRTDAQRVVQFAHYRVHLPDAPRLSSSQLRAAVAGAASADEAVRGLARAYYELGLLSAQLSYAVDGDDLYVAVHEHAISAVHAPPVLLPYFESLLGTSSLRDDDFEPRRALANVHAERAGIDAQAQLVPDQRAEARGYMLDIEQQGSRRDANTVSADFWNPGNRFAGRNFFDLDARHSNKVGDQFKLLWHTALTGLGDSRAEHYNEETLTWSRATTWGALGLTGHAYDYRSDDELDGQLRELQAAWLYPLRATLRSRWLLDVRAEYTHLDHDVHVDADDGDAAIATQSEEYPSLQAGLHYSRSDVWRGRPVDVDLGLTLRQGLRGDRATSGADLDYFLWRPTANLNVSLSDAFDTGLTLAAQFSDDRTPEQSQWVLGGIDNIAAYLPGIAVGDSGAYAALDLQYAGWTVAGIALKPRLFAEYGYSRYAQMPGQNDIQLSDVGAELGLAWRQLRASLAAALPVEHQGVDDRLRRDSEANLLFRLTARF